MLSQKTGDYFMNHLICSGLLDAPVDERSHSLAMAMTSRKSQSQKILAHFLWPGQQTLDCPLQQLPPHCHQCHGLHESQSGSELSETLMESILFPGFTEHGSLTPLAMRYTASHLRHMLQCIVTFLSMLNICTAPTNRIMIPLLNHIK